MFCWIIVITILYIVPTIAAIWLYIKGDLILIFELLELKNFLLSKRVQNFEFKYKKNFYATLEIRSVAVPKKW
jgi:formate hydrogenlyase subunit 4